MINEYADQPYTEYCTRCESAIWFIRKGDLLVPINDSVRCRCTWQCCPDTLNRIHPPHQARKPRIAGEYVISTKQVARLIDLMAMMPYKSAVLQIVPALNGIPYLYYMDDHKFKFDENEVVNYISQNIPPEWRRADE